MAGGPRSLDRFDRLGPSILAARPAYLRRRRYSRQGRPARGPARQDHFGCGDSAWRRAADPSFLAQWLANGADATFRSYGVDVSGLIRKSAAPEAWRRAFLASLPDTHRDFFDTLELAVSFGDYLFVHAGVRPGVPLEAQDPMDLVWIRGPFLKSDQDFGKIVVHGHTPTRTPEIRANRIGIDTGAVFTDRLTALRLENGSRELLQVD